MNAETEKSIILSLLDVDNTYADVCTLFKVESLEMINPPKVDDISIKSKDKKYIMEHIDDYKAFVNYCSRYKSLAELLEKQLKTLCLVFNIKSNWDELKTEYGHKYDKIYADLMKVNFKLNYGIEYKLVNLFHYLFFLNFSYCNLDKFFIGNNDLMFLNATTKGFCDCIEENIDYLGSLYPEFKEKITESHKFNYSYIPIDLPDRKYIKTYPQDIFIFQECRNNIINKYSFEDIMNIMNLNSNHFFNPRYAAQMLEKNESINSYEINVLLCLCLTANDCLNLFCNKDRFFKKYFGKIADYNICKSLNPDKTLSEHKVPLCFHNDLYLKNLFDDLVNGEEYFQEINLDIVESTAVKLSNNNREIKRNK